MIHTFSLKMSLFYNWLVKGFLCYWTATASQLTAVLPLLLTLVFQDFPDSKVYFIERFDVDCKLVYLNTFEN